MNLRTNIQNTFNFTPEFPFNYIAYSQEELFAATEGKKCEGLESTIDFKKRKMDKTLEDYGEKTLKGNSVD